MKLLPRYTYKNLSVKIPRKAAVEFLIRSSMSRNNAIARLHPILRSRGGDAEFKWTTWINGEELIGYAPTPFDALKNLHNARYPMAEHATRHRMIFEFLKICAAKLEELRNRKASPLFDAYMTGVIRVISALHGILIDKHIVINMLRKWPDFKESEFMSTFDCDFSLHEDVLWESGRFKNLSYRHNVEGGFFDILEDTDFRGTIREEDGHFAMVLDILPERVFNVSTLKKALIKAYHSINEFRADQTLDMSGSKTTRMILRVMDDYNKNYVKGDPYSESDVLGMMDVVQWLQNFGVADSVFINDSIIDPYL